MPPFFGFGYGGEDSFTPTTSNFPASGFQQSAFADALTGDPASEYRQLFNMMTPGPATQSYLNYIQQVPTREGYQPSTMQKIMSLISGAAYGLTGHPELGAKSGQEIQDYNFNRAMGDYLNKAKALAPGATIEEERQKEAASLLPQILKAQIEGKEFGVTSGQNQQKITNEAAFQSGELKNAAERNRLQAENDKLQALHNAGMLSVAQFNAQTAANRQKLDELESPVRMAEARARAANYMATGEKRAQPNQSGALTKIQQESALKGDEYLNSNPDFWIRTERGTRLPNEAAIYADPVAKQRYQEIMGMAGGRRPSPVPSSSPGAEDLPAPYMDYLGQFYGNK